MFDSDGCRLSNGGIFLSRWGSLNMVLTARLLRIFTPASIVAKIAALHQAGTTVMATCGML
jgi:hypothetical protein